MTTGQWRVFGILAVLLGVEVFTSSTASSTVAGLLSGKGVNLSGVPQATIGFGLAGVGLIALAAWQEGFATGLALLFLVLVLINKSEQIAPAVSAAGDAIATLTGKGGSSNGSNNNNSGK